MYFKADYERLMDEHLSYLDEVHEPDRATRESEYWEDLLDDLPPDEEPDNTPKFLNNQDYTLNSPLICDELDAFKEYFLQGKKNTLYYTKNWDERVEWMGLIRGNWSTLIPTVNYHKECSKLWLQSEVDLRGIKELINETDEAARKTHVVVEAFYNTWLNHKIAFKSKAKCSESTFKYGAYMWEFIKLAWLLNSATVHEREELKKFMKFSYILPNKKESGVKYNSSLLGTLFVGNGIIYFQRMNMIWDRNMVLMFKDTSTARFHTLFAIQHRFTNDYSQEHLGTIERLYVAGDHMVAFDTISAFEGLGLVEPLASLLLSELAGQFRPLIPKFPHFRKHVESKIEEISLKNHASSDFFKVISEVKDKRILFTIYGSFRHWGHPFISYLTGLEALYQNVTSTKDIIDKDYAEILASDLAFKVLKKEYWSKFKWFVDGHQLPDSNPLKNHILNNTWPSLEVLLDYPPEWHKLPLLPCWDIPEVVDPSIIYSDKTHSIQRSELLHHLSVNPNSPIPTRKVLNTLLKTPSTNWPVFLRRINDMGLSLEDLIIGLKAKEREIKWKGRFFALMSWSLREYFVFTEYLIKKNVIPLFKGLTMADDQTTLVKKMLSNTGGQGENNYKNITIANHIDYEKWNNFQRYDATAPVFKVLGQFHGLPNLFVRTHEFFEKSLVYYRDRPDLMTVNGGQVENRYPEKRVCWNGQAGGLEGLRQKGWSVLNLLVIERESKIRNTAVQTLAQGDNQVICTQYKLNPSKNVKEISEHLDEIVKNNEVIMGAIRKATGRIGLRINNDETLQAADMLVYGKTIVFRGNLTCLEEKRYSRITCTTNDQLPSLGNILSTVSTNCLTVAHYSKSPKNAIVNYNWLGNFVLKITNIHNPALRGSPLNSLKKPKELETVEFNIAVLYLDPSLGGISGMSLTRFNLRMFPDPVTEGLTFWKMIYNGSSNPMLQRLSMVFGNPKLMSYRLSHFRKLLEDPGSLNLPHGLSAQNLIKDEIKKALLKNPERIEHEIIREALYYYGEEEENFLVFLSEITPCFPRFLSEMRSASYFGMTASIIGLFENSKTIRNAFKRGFRDIVDSAIIKCEISSIEAIRQKSISRRGMMWSCSAKHADELREMSWEQRIVGTTVPHPAEMLQLYHLTSGACIGCGRAEPRSIKIVTLVPVGMDLPEDFRGPLHPYLGSSTGENTSLIQPWEKDTDISFIRKASNMRRAFHWFVEPDSNLGRSINGNIKALTGEDPGDTIKGFKRTGSFLHRFGCSRVSAGGYIANSPVYGSRMIISTDSFQLLGDTNYDFMYQPLMLFAQQTVGEYHGETGESGIYHLHIDCTGCLREIEEPTLDSTYEYPFKDVSQSLSKWVPSGTQWFNEPIGFEIPIGNWKIESLNSQSQTIGCLQAVVYANLSKSYSDTNVLNGLFPIGIRNKVHGPAYLLGIVDGLYRASVIDACHRRVFFRASDVSHVIRACYLNQVDKLCAHPAFLTFSQGESITTMLKNQTSRIPPSYPLNNIDMGNMVRSYLQGFSYNKWRTICFIEAPRLWIFADFASVQLSGLLIVAYQMSLELDNPNIQKMHSNMKEYSNILSALRSGQMTTKIQDVIKLSSKINMCPQEVRHAIKMSMKKPIAGIKRSPEEDKFTNIVHVNINFAEVLYSISQSPHQSQVVPRLQNPLISGIRIPQIATGAFLKVDGLLNGVEPRVCDALVGGDGSGGISALVLRKYPETRLIFNSLLTMEEVDLAGSLPRPPSAIDYMPGEIKSRCVNLNTAYENATDLSKAATWAGFIRLKKIHGLKMNLGIFDMEIQNGETMDQIEKLLYRHLRDIFEINSTIIFKTYLDRLYSKSNFLSNVGHSFHSVLVTQNELSSSHTSEVYIVAQRLRTKENIRLYPDWDFLDTFAKSAYCFQSYESEFNRARKVLKIDLCKGIPVKYLPSSVDELQSLWLSIGRDRAALIKWGTELVPGRRSSFHYSICTLMLVVNQVLNTTRWLNDPQIDIPSDNQLSQVMSFYVGTVIYAGLISNDCRLAQQGQKLIDNPFKLYFGAVPRMTSKREKKYSMCWGFIRTKLHTKYKTVYLQDQMSLIGATLRCWLHWSKLKGADGQETYMTMLSQMNKNLTASHVSKYTGILDIFP